MSVAKRLSPGASLLRQSRLMAMPAPVPPPPPYFLTNPDVSPHPTVQAITTPKSSHARGNWGLKRDLPKKTNYPFLRYTSLDTLEHFMNYESAADDVITLKKWQEMDIPILKGPGINHEVFVNNYGLKESVFDGGIDGQGGEKYKWRYEGPHLPDVPAGDFKRYIKNKIRPRREEFIRFVAANLPSYTSDDNQNSSFSSSSGLEARSPSETQRRATAEGREASLMDAPAPTPEIDPADVDLVALRGDLFLLERLVLGFLDIPFYSRPHRTHPSGGLHYTRSSAPVRNDPEKGPRTERKPVPGRSMNFLSATGALIGIGGVVAKANDAGRIDDTGRVHNNRTLVRQFAPGMAKLDALGRVLLEVDTVNEDGSQGNYGGYRSGMYSRAGDPNGKETAADLLKSYVPRSYANVYSEEPPRPRGVVGGRFGGGQTQDVMDLLKSFDRR